MQPYNLKSVSRFKLGNWLKSPVFKEYLIYLGRQSSFGSYPILKSIWTNYYMARSGQCSIHILRGPWSTSTPKFHLTRPEESWWNFIPPIPQGQTKAPRRSWFASFNKNSWLRCPVIKESLVYSGRQSSFGSHPSDKEGKLVKFRQLSNSRKWSTTDHQLLPAAKHHSSFFIIFSLEIKIKCLLSFANLLPKSQSSNRDFICKSERA